MSKKLRKKIKKDSFGVRFALLSDEIRRCFSPEGELLDPTVGIVERILWIFETSPPIHRKKRVLKKSSK